MVFIKAKKGFKFELISDRDAELSQLFKVLQPKNLFGIKFDGIERSTFLIDKNGILQQEWRKVKVNGHIKEVLAAAQKLNAH